MKRSTVIALALGIAIVCGWVAIRTSNDDSGSRKSDAASAADAEAARRDGAVAPRAAGPERSGRGAAKLGEALARAADEAGTEVREASLFQTPLRNDVEPTPEGKDVIAETNAYFASSVWPRLREWFAELPAGKIRFSHHVVNDGEGSWRAREGDEAVQLVDSSLPPELDAVALECMREAVRDTTFPVPAIFEGEKTNVVFWTWTTPVVQPYEDALAARGKIGRQ